MTPAAEAVATLHPASFALVMATGIVSIACFLLVVPWVPVVLFAANLLFYAGLWVVTAIRIVRFRSSFIADLSHHGRAVG